MAGVHIHMNYLCSSLTLIQEQPTFVFHVCCYQARKLLRELKYQKRCEEAVTTIAAFWHGTQVLTVKTRAYQTVWYLPQQHH